MKIDKDLKYLFDEVNKYKILFTYKDDKTLKNYVVYTDGTKKEDGSMNAYGAIYNPDNLDESLKEINQKEWEVLGGILKSIVSNIK